MAIDLYELAIRFKSEGFAAISKDLDTIDKKGKGISKAFTALKASLIVGAVGGFIRKIAVESSEAQKQAAQLNAVLKSTGGIAGVTAGDIDKMASSLQKTTTFSDEAVKSAASLLLTFTNIRGEIFKNTLPVLLDMSQALGQDLKSSAIQVGKALNDPIEGVSALQRVGVSFTESQKEVIKKLVETGKMAKAQQLILAELTTEFGGSAAAARNTLGGALAALGNAWSDLFEVTQDSSKGIIGAINRIADALPRLREFFDDTFGGLITWLEKASLRFENVALDASNAGLALHAAFTFDFAELELIAGQIKKMGDNAERYKQIVNSVAGDKNRPNDPMSERNEITAARFGGGRKTAPPGGTGKGTGKAGKGPEIPAFNMPEFQLPGTIFDDVDSGHLDMFGALVPAMEESYENFHKAQEALGERFKTDAEILWESIAESTKVGIAQTLGDAIYNGFAAAFNGEGVGGILKAFGKTILAGLGDIMVQQGQALLAYGITMQAAAWGFTNPFTAGPAAIAAGAALIALGSAFGAISKGGGGRGTAQSGAFRENQYGRGTEEMTRLKFVNRDGTAAGLEPRQAMVFNVIGPHDPRAQRYIMEMIENGSRRRG